MVDVADGLVDYFASSSGAAHVELRTPDHEGAVRGLTAARRALFAIPHPEEPDDPLPSFASDVTVSEQGATFWFDAADAEEYDGLLERVVDALREAIEREGVDGSLTWPDSS